MRGVSDSDARAMNILMEQVAGRSGIQQDWPLNWGDQFQKIYQTDDKTYYIDGALGNDANDGSLGRPMKTISAALDKQSLILNACNITVDIAAGTYAETVNMIMMINSGISAGVRKGCVRFLGKWEDVTPATGLATGTFDADFTAGTVLQDALQTGGGWTVNALKGLFLEPTSGDWAGFRFPILSNAASSMRIGYVVNQTVPASGSLKGFFGKDLQSASWKLVRPSVKIQLPASSPAGTLLVNVGGIENDRGSSFWSSPTATWSDSEAVNLGFQAQGIAFEGTSANSFDLFRTTGISVRFDQCSFKAIATNSTAAMRCIGSFGSGSQQSLNYCWLETQQGATQTYLVDENAVGSTLNLLGVACNSSQYGFFDHTGANTFLNIWAGAWATTKDAIATTSGALAIQGAVSIETPSIAISVNGRTTVSCSPTSVVDPTKGLKFQGTNAASSIGIFVSANGSLITSTSPMTGLCIDGFLYGIKFAGNGSQLKMSACTISNCNTAGVSFERQSTTAFATFSGLHYATTATFTNNGGGTKDFTFDNSTFYTKAAVDLLADKFVGDDLTHCLVRGL